MSDYKSAWNTFLNEQVKKLCVHGYIKPEQAFRTLSEWEVFVNKILKFQKDGHYVSHGHGQIVGPNELQELIDEFYGFQLSVDVERYDLLTTKNVLDHIEDFVNHRYFPESLRFRERSIFWSCMHRTISSPPHFHKNKAMIPDQLNGGKEKLSNRSKATLIHPSKTRLLPPYLGLDKASQVRNA